MKVEQDIYGSHLFESHSVWTAEWMRPYSTDNVNHLVMVNFVGRIEPVFVVLDGLPQDFDSFERVYTETLKTLADVPECDEISEATFWEDRKAIQSLERVDVENVELVDE